MCVVMLLWPTGKIPFGVWHLSPVVATWLLSDSAFFSSLSLLGITSLFYSAKLLAESSIFINQWQ